MFLGKIEAKNKQQTSLLQNLQQGNMIQDNVIMNVCVGVNTKGL